MLDVHRVGEFPFEGVDIGSANERIVANDRRYRRVDLAFDGLVLKLQIRKGYRHRSCFLFPPCQPASWVARIGSGNRNIPGHDRTRPDHDLSLIHISEPTRQAEISYA